MTLEHKLKRALESKNQDEILRVFEEIYNRYSNLIFFTISQIVDTKEDVEELTQDVFLKFFNNLQKTKIDNIKYYLVVSAKHNAINHLKRKKNEVIYDDNIVYAAPNYNDDIIIKYEYGELIKEMKKNLEDYEISIIIEHVVYDLTFKEIAEKYKKPLKTILSNYYRAIEKMKKGGVL